MRALPIDDEVHRDERVTHVLAVVLVILVAVGLFALVWLGRGGSGVRTILVAAVVALIVGSILVSVFEGATQIPEPTASPAPSTGTQTPLEYRSPQTPSSSQRSQAQGCATTIAAILIVLGVGLLITLGICAAMFSGL